MMAENRSSHPRTLSLLLKQAFSNPSKTSCCSWVKNKTSTSQRFTICPLRSWRGSTGQTSYNGMSWIVKWQTTALAIDWYLSRLSFEDLLTCCNFANLEDHVFGAHRELAPLINFPRVSQHFADLKVQQWESGDDSQCLQEMSENHWIALCSTHIDMETYHLDYCHPQIGFPDGHPWKTSSGRGLFDL